MAQGSLRVEVTLTCAKCGTTADFIVRRDPTAKGDPVTVQWLCLGCKNLVTSQQPAGTDKSMRRKLDRLAHERAVFEEFGTAVALDVDNGSTTSGNPDKREPDILCRLTGKPYGFELGRMAYEEHTTKTAQAIASRQMTGGAVSMERVLTETLGNKIDKQYDTGGAPVDLLLYFDNELAETATYPPDGDFNEWAKKYLEPILAKNRGPFSRVWVWDRDAKRLLWHG